MYNYYKKEKDGGRLVFYPILLSEILVLFYYLASDLLNPLYKIAGVVNEIESMFTWRIEKENMAGLFNAS